MPRCGSGAQEGAITRGSGGGGFTLIEMLVVLVVLALIAGLVLQHGPARSRTLESGAAVAGLVRTLRAARGQAIAADRPVVVAIDPVRRSVSVAGGPARALPPQLAVSVTAALGEGPAANVAGIRFEPDGSSSGGRIQLADGARRWLIGVDWLTGRVALADAP